MQKINLFISYFQCGDKERQKELDFCFKHNQESGYFSSIINFDNRPTYNDFFKATEDYPDDINVFANCDIYFNETIKLVSGMGNKDAYALTRWELEDGELVTFSEKHVYNNEAKPRHSQDVWVFNGAATRINGGFHIGVAGCDNRIAYEIMRAGYRLTNPSNNIQCIHKHESDERNYTVPEGYRNGKVSPPYKWVEVDQTNEVKTRKPI
jgi:hypothetical protein